MSDKYRVVPSGTTRENESPIYFVCNADNLRLHICVSDNEKDADHIAATMNAMERVKEICRGISHKSQGLPYRKAVFDVNALLDELEKLE